MSAVKKSIIKPRKPPTPSADRTLADFLDRLPMKKVFKDPEWQAVFEHLQMMNDDQKRNLESDAPPFDNELLQTSMDGLNGHINLIKLHASRYSKTGHCD